MFRRKGVTRVESDDSDLTKPEVAEGFSLEELGSAYAQAMGISADSQSHEIESSNEGETLESDSSKAIHEELLLAAPGVAESDDIPVTPESILEAMLFLGSNNNRPLSAEKISECIRGMTVAEVDGAVDRLNGIYRDHGRAMEIAREPGGYRLQLASDLNLVRDKFYAKVKETQLSQAAIDCLALVAYQAGITRGELERQWNQPASGMLSLLVRRGLLRVETKLNAESKPDACYYTTERFLEVIGLESLDDLPLAEDLG